MDQKTSLSQHWKLFLDEVEQEYGKETLDRWARSLKIDISTGALTLFAKDSFQSLWVQEHLSPKLATYLAAHEFKVKISVLLDGHISAKSKQKIKKISEEKKTSGFSLYIPELDPTAVLDRFLTHDGNVLAKKALDECCFQLVQQKLKSLSNLHTPHSEPPPFLPNPVYVYGPSGSGKTHLFQGMAQKLRQAGFKVMCASADLFTEHVIKSIRAGEMTYFRRLWRHADALFIDDIQNLAKKSATQEEFFHTFNTLHVANTPIFLSANCMPQQLQFIEPRLISRFEWGIVLDIATLPKKMFRTLLEQKAESHHFTLSNKIVDFIIDRFSSSPKASVQALEAVILRTTIATSSAKKGSPTFSEEQLISLLKDLLEEEERSALTLERIVGLTAQQYGTTVSDILGKSQARDCVLPRQIAMYLLRKHLKLPYMKIGDTFFRDHSTVMSAIRQIEKLIKDSASDVGSQIAALEIQLQTT